MLKKDAPKSKVANKKKPIKNPNIDTVLKSVFISKFFIFWPKITSILRLNKGKKIMHIICKDANKPIFSGVYIREIIGIEIIFITSEIKELPDNKILFFSSFFITSLYLIYAVHYIH